MNQRYEKFRIDRAIRAFSLSELMVAVGILGIGMIMVAMAFPVALDQSRQATELSNSKLVYSEAVNTLKTQVKWTELDTYINPAPALGAREGDYRLGNDELTQNDHRIYLLSFRDDVINDAGGVQAPEFFSGLTPANCIYSVDETYGWVAAVQKISNKTYKFWIFVMREPSGMTVIDTDDGNEEKFKFQLSVHPHQVNPHGTSNDTRQLDFGGDTPFKGTVFLGDNGAIFKVTETVPGNNIVMCDRLVRQDGTDLIDYVAYPVRNTAISVDVDVRITRKNPVLSVYQTVISY